MSQARRFGARVAFARARTVLVRAARTAGTNVALIEEDAVAHRDHLVGGRCDPRVVGDDHEGLPRFVEVVEQAEDVERRLAVQVAGGLVGQDQQRFVHQGPGHRDALALAAGQRGRHVGGPVGEPHLLQQAECTLARRAGRAPGQQRGQFHILHRGQLVHQLEGLEDEPDGIAPEPGQCPFAHGVDALAGDRDPAFVGSVQPAEQVEERGLPASAGAGDGQGLPRGDIEVECVERPYLPVPRAGPDACSSRPPVRARCLPVPPTAFAFIGPRSGRQLRPSGTGAGYSPWSSRRPGPSIVPPFVARAR